MNRSLDLQLKDYRLTTAEIIYRLPDHPSLLQSFIWQQLDLAPLYPVLRKFLNFWERNLDGQLHLVQGHRGEGDQAGRIPLRPGRVPAQLTVAADCGAASRTRRLVALPT